MDGDVRNDMEKLGYQKNWRKIMKKRIVGGRW